MATPARTALAPIQTTSSENEMVGRKTSTTVNKKSGEYITSTKDRVTKPSSKARNGPASRRKCADKGIQTTNPDIELITGDEPPLAYWKELAEARGKALEETLQENDYLHKRIEDLESDNRMLEDMVQDAKQLAELIADV